MPRLRDFIPSALEIHKSPRLHQTWNHGWFFESRAWQFVIFLPRWLVKEDEEEEICTARDERLLEGLLQRDFGGCTTSLSSFRGDRISWLRDRDESSCSGYRHCLTLEWDHAVLPSAPEGTRSMQRRRADSHPSSRAGDRVKKTPWTVNT